MGDIKIEGQTIVKGDNTVEGIKAIDPRSGIQITVSVSKHETGGRAWVKVSNGITGETRMPKPGTETEINGVMVIHERG